MISRLNVDSRTQKREGVNCLQRSSKNYVRRGQNPCEAHQEEIDAKAEQEFMEAYYRGDEEMMEAIISSPFTNFGKNMGRRNEINTSF
ncbi:MAG: hypothetical protein QIT36_gp031 [Methanophagales virus GBV301]|uniref:Uncharacterized protein n=1 Tax=Methanophagales virus GBV301 TaxID=2999280 RepID=A0A9E8V8B3_9CAUD|nr:MAG: hypothetical protein QIT36_gp031 [Methanophagales virus GBV301]WAE39455.1 MAG: hypothetical protein LDLAKGPJ_00031 [Methanophagales virus GBV301]